MQPKPESIEKAKRWLSPVWAYTGAETPEEHQLLAAAFNTAANWMGCFLEGMEPRWLVFVGVSGTGKTMLAKRIAEYVERYGRALYDRTTGQYLAPDNPRRSWAMAQQGLIFAPWRLLLKERGWMDLAARDFFCVVDEIKSESGRRIAIDGEEGIQPEPWETRNLGNLFDDMGRRWRIVTMNLTRSQLALFWDVRIASRLTRDDNAIADLSAVSDFQLRKELSQKPKP